MRSLMGRRRDVAIALGLFLLPFGVYVQLVVPGPMRRWFPDGDFVDQFFAFARYEVSRLAAGQLPVWNPYAYAGSPFWADVQAAVAYPPSLANALVNAWLRGSMAFTALELEAVAHLGLAAAFTYAFALRTLGSRPGAVVAAATFALGGYLNGYPPLQLAVLETAVWLPAALLGVELLATAAPPLGMAVLGAALASSLLAGHPQTALHVLYATAAYAAWRHRPWRRRRRRVAAALAGAGLLAAAASAAGWLPALEYLGLSNRAAVPYDALAHGFPIGELTGLLLPGLTRWSPLYIGVLPLLLAAGAVAVVVAGGHRPGPDAAGNREGLPGLVFWAGLGLVALLVSLGGNGPLFDLLYLGAPGWDLFRGQERAAFLVSFAAAMLAGSGAALWCAGGQAVRRTVRRTVLYGAPALAAMYVVVIVVGAPEHRGMAVRGLAMTLAAAALAASPRPWPRGRWTAAAVAILAADLVVAVAGANLVDHPPGELTEGPAEVALRETMAQRVQNDDRLPLNFGVLWGLESTSGASPLWLRTWEELVTTLKPVQEARLWDLLAVSHVVTWRGDVPVPAVMVAEAGEGPDIQRTFAQQIPPPRAWRVSAARRVDDAQAAALLVLDDFDPFGEVLLHDGPGGRFPGGGGSIVETNIDPGRIAVSTDGPRPAWILFSEMHYPGWVARVDGEPAPVLRADVALIAVPVPAGRHDVSLAFVPGIVAWGIALSFGAWVVIVGLAILAGLPGAGGRRLAT